MEASCVLGMPADDYHSHPAVSRSQLGALKLSPAHYKAEHIDRVRERKTTPAMQLGTAIHTAVLEPDAFWLRYYSGEKINRQSSAGKAAHAARELENIGKIFIDTDDLSVVEGVAGSVRAHRGLALVLGSSPIREASFFWTDPDTGVACRCRPDAISSDHAYMLDLKSTICASPREFERSIADLEYHVQHAFYVDGVKAVTGIDCTMIFGAAEKTPPFAASLMSLDDESVEIGRTIYKQRLRTLAECMSSGKWPAYGDSISIVSLPEWAKRRFQNE